MNLQSGKNLKRGDYRIIKMLGQGGFGITYLCEQVGLGRKVAVKEFFMKEHCNRDASTSYVSVPSIGSKELVEKFKQKFLKEARMIAGLRHSNIISIYDVFEENGTAYYVMAYLEGGSLKDKVLSSGGKLGEKQSIKYIRQMAEALGYIHKKNILHLDVKPGNVMFDEKGEAVLIDFGVSKCYDEEGGQTSSTPVGKSAGYAPKEQYDQSGLIKFSPATDIYSLGATLYYLLTGETPPNAFIVDEDGLPEEDLRKNGITEKTIEAIRAAMQPNRKDRPQSVEEFLSKLEGEKLEGEQKNREKEVDVSVWEEKTEIEEIRFEEDRRYQATHGKIKGHEYVDLGLPSGLKWATCNVGASSPEEYGNYYAWGETKTKFVYNWGNSKTYGEDIGNISGNAKYDVARAKWGGTWRLPTKAEFEELIDNCTWTWTTRKGKNGYKVTGPNGNYIFLPAAGYRNETSLKYAGTRGHFWSSTPRESSTQGAYYLSFNSSILNSNSCCRYYGNSVRPVSE